MGPGQPVQHHALTRQLLPAVVGVGLRRRVRIAGLAAGTAIDGQGAQQQHGRVRAGGFTHRAHHRFGQRDVRGFSTGGVGCHPGRVGQGRAMHAHLRTAKQLSQRGGIGLRRMHHRQRRMPGVRGVYREPGRIAHQQADSQSGVQQPRHRGGADVSGHAGGRNVDAAGRLPGAPALRVRRLHRRGRDRLFNKTGIHGAGPRADFDTTVAGKYGLRGQSPPPQSLENAREGGADGHR
mmetsp:Transcript_53291/g.125115  ORF Transcript_53291/g.125115 Transcript_53291/m.125115 type:complete len:236 (+) Transcript_53291:1125-1832(+)